MNSSIRTAIFLAMAQQPWRDPQEAYKFTAKVPALLVMAQRAATMEGQDYEDY